MTDQMKQARDEKAMTYGYNNAIYIDKAMLNKEGYQYLEEKPAKDFREGTDWFRNNVWHDTNEKPEECKELLAYKKRDCGSSFYTALYCSDNDSMYINGCWYKLSTMTRWAYIEDLVADDMI